MQLNINFRPAGMVEYGSSKTLQGGSVGKSGSAVGQQYKPIPPPKPKNYRPPQQLFYGQSNGYQHASVAYGSHDYSPHLHNGVGLFTYRKWSVATLNFMQ